MHKLFNIKNRLLFIKYKTFVLPMSINLKWSIFQSSVLMALKRKILIDINFKRYVLLIFINTYTCIVVHEIEVFVIFTIYDFYLYALFIQTKQTSEQKVYAFGTQTLLYKTVQTSDSICNVLWTNIKLWS